MFIGRYIYCVKLSIRAEVDKDTVVSLNCLVKVMVSGLRGFSIYTSRVERIISSNEGGGEERVLRRNCNHA